ncbi:MAG: O-methyltransferase [Chitinophagaceae bacterium]|nr:O-methyltransferase [Chitinophagaceae bacterium]
MDITHPLAQQYAEKYTSSEDPLLKEISDFTSANHPQAQMLSGHLQGKFFEMISCMIQPERILEIGTFTGYSAICFARGLKQRGRLHTIEIDDKVAAIAQEYFNRSKFGKQIILHVGNALKVLNQLSETWDLVFIDADKEGYINYFNRVLPKVRKNGYILADNVLFHGQVLENRVKGKNAKAIKAFNDYVQSRTDVEKMMLPLRDGIYLIRKL